MGNGIRPSDFLNLLKRACRLPSPSQRRNCHLGFWTAHMLARRD